MDKPITTILFDLDGTLLDTNELIMQSFERLLGNHYPGQYTRKEILPFLGPTLAETFNKMDPSKTEVMIQEYREWNMANHDRLVAEFDGVTEVLTQLANNGIRMAIVSTKRNDMVRKGLDLIGITQLFEVIIGLDDVQRPKPDPEPLLLAIDRLDASKEEVLMVGDNFHDIEGGKNAGVRTAAVAWSAKGPEFLSTFNPDYMLTHISDLYEIVGVTAT
ncbi:pyrophosphatase PpaX [Sporosarcina gallistercoris]|uniref:Pyrophosphatase PpaX n=1 Tax=Sporosarcina gallistercoris TaxID=2762245 RepID=A0ABR8PL93_9BACL|nr:pyrophosphatase PpaX [Sporosarcina gallistercoris]MBD7908932.1 pyrophosphatase PpaX [Sporosarcina gallistercoris]